MTVDWVCKHHNDLGKEQLYAILRLRNEVFVVEQKCIYQDIDGQDLLGDTHHLMAWKDDELVAYLRLLDPDTQGGDVVVGRVIVAPAASVNITVTPATTGSPAVCRPSRLTSIHT